jgi:hypothetical protein
LKRVKKGACNPLSYMSELCGPPPLLASEEEEDYCKLAAAIIETVEPTDAIEWILTNDVINHTFEIRRFRRIKVGLMERRSIVFGTHEDDSDTGDGNNADDADVIEVDDACNFRLLAQGDAELFNSCSSEFELADRLETLAQARLARVLIQIDVRRASLRERLHVASNRIISEKYKNEARHDNRSSNASKRASKLGANRGMNRKLDPRGA